MRSVRRDRAVDEPGVGGEQCRRVDAEPLCGARRIALEHDVSVTSQREEGSLVVSSAQVELDAPTAAQPRVVPGRAAERIAARRLDLDDVGSVVGEQHPGDGTGDAPRQVEHPHSVQHAGHVRLLLFGQSRTSTAPVRLELTSTATRVGNLIDGSPPQLTGGLEDQVQSVDVALADETAVRVARQRPVEGKVAVGDEVLRFADPAEPERFELHEQDRRERVVDHRHVDVVASDAPVVEQAARRARPSRP